MWLLYVIAGLAVIAGLSSGIALGLHLAVPGWSQRRRVLISAAIAALLPMSVVFGGFLLEARRDFADDGSDYMLAFLALFALQVILWAIVSLPPAWFTTKRLERGRGREDGGGELPPAEQPHMLEG